jgi:hypothetical protein
MEQDQTGALTLLWNLLILVDEAEYRCGFGGGIDSRKGGVGAPPAAHQPAGFPWLGTSSPTGNEEQPARRVCLSGEQSVHAASRNLKGLCRQVAVNLPLDVAASAQPDHARPPGNDSGGSIAAAACGQQTRTWTAAGNVDFLPAIESRGCRLYRAINVSPKDQMSGVLLSGPPKKQ